MWLCEALCFYHMWNHALFMWMPTVDNFLTNNFWLSLQNLHTWKNVTFLFNKFSMKYILIYNDTKKKKNPRISLFLNRCIWIVSENLCWQGSWLTDLAYCTVIPWKHLAWAWSSVEEWQGTLFLTSSMSMLCSDSSLPVWPLCVQHAF